MPSRRDFILGTTATVGLIGLGCDADGTDATPGADGGSSADAQTGGSDAAVGSDAGATCTPTRGDAQGPFFEEGAPSRSVLADETEPGARLIVEAVLVASDCMPIAGATLDIWQADADGVYHDAEDDYRLRGQVTTAADGRFMLETIRPGNYGQPDGSMRPAHIHVKAEVPGFAPVTTQIYFAGDPFLSPNDGCTGCGSDDEARIMTLTGDADAGFVGQLQLVLATT